MKKIGLALSTGGARGLSHIGVINVLKKNNIPIPSDKKGAPPFSIDDNLYHT